MRKKAQASQKQNTAPHVLSRGGYEYLEEKLMAEKTKKRLEEAAQSGSTRDVSDIFICHFHFLVYISFYNNDLHLQVLHYYFIGPL